MNYYHILLLLLVVLLIVLLIYTYIYYSRGIKKTSSVFDTIQLFKQMVYSYEQQVERFESNKKKKSFNLLDKLVGGDINEGPEGETSDTDEPGGEKEATKLNKMYSFFSKKFKKNNTPETTQPYYNGAEYKIKNTYEYNNGHEKLMKISNTPENGLNPYEDVPFIKKIVKNKDGTEKEWQSIPKRNKYLIKEINKQFTPFAMYVEDIENDDLEKEDN